MTNPATSSRRRGVSKTNPRPPIDADRLWRIRDFLSFLYKGKERIYFFPIMQSAIAKAKKDDPSFPDAVGRIRLKWPSGNIIERFSRAPLSTTLSSRRFEAAIQKLDRLNELGYDIFFTPNPLGHPRRLQATVRQFRTVVVESDTLDLQEQRHVWKALRHHFCCAVFSGNKSVHFYARLDEPKRNPGYVRDWRIIKDLAGGKVSNPIHDAIVLDWKLLLKEQGVSFDSAVLSDISRLTRLPGFIHHGSGKRSRYVRRNPSAFYSDRLPPEWKGPSLPRRRARYRRWKAFLQGRITYGYAGDLTTRSFPEMPDLLCEDASLFGKESSGECEVTGKTMLQHASSDLPPQRPPGMGFLHEMERWEDLRENGLPARHTRLSLHPIVFTARRVYRWSDQRMQAEWKEVIRKNPAATDKSPDEAASDLQAHWQIVQNSKWRIWP